MTEEVVPNLTFGNYKMGRPIQVDIHDPTVRGLIKAGYLKIRWKEPNGTDPLDPAGSERVSADRVDSDDPRSTAAEEVDHGQGEHRPAEEEDDSSESGA